MSSRRWWQDAVVYQIYPRSFSDANCDGIGDLEGIISRLDYIRSLSCDAIWISPCFPSPQLDHGYDVADYFDINPDYGTLETFDKLVAEARTRGIKILLDIVPNHCSNQHRWFVDAVAAGRGSRERARFYFRDGRGESGELPPNNWISVFGGSAWTRVDEPDGSPGQWYLHVFTPWQPDFNWENEEVKQHFDDVLTFWFDRGVEGFRVDAVSVVGKTEGLPDMPEVPVGLSASEIAARNPHFQMKDVAHNYWRRWRELIDRYEAEHPGREILTVSEAYTPRRPDLLLKFVKADQFHQSFCFDLMMTPWVADLIRRAVDEAYEALYPAGAHLSWTLNNHDTHRAVTRYGRKDATSPESWTGNNLVYSGAPVDESLGLRRSAAMIAFAAGLPGALYLYQGEELGLPEWLDMPDDRREDPIFSRSNHEHKGRDGCRVPLPWTDESATSFGFSPRPVDPWLPQPTDWGKHAVSKLDTDPASLLNFYRTLMAARRVHVHGEPLEWLDSGHAGVLAYRSGSISVIMNTTSSAVELPPSILAGRNLVVSSGRCDGKAIEGDSTVWLA